MADWADEKAKELFLRWLPPSFERSRELRFREDTAAALRDARAKGIEDVAAKLQERSYYRAAAEYVRALNTAAGAQDEEG